MIVVHDTLSDLLQLGDPPLDEGPRCEDGRRHGVHRQIEEADAAQLEIGPDGAEALPEDQGGLVQVEHDEGQEAGGEREEEAEEGRRG